MDNLIYLIRAYIYYQARNVASATRLPNGISSSNAIRERADMVAAGQPTPIERRMRTTGGDGNQHSPIKQQVRVVAATAQTHRTRDTNERMVAAHPAEHKT